MYSKGWRRWCSQRKEQPCLPSAQILLGEWETKSAKQEPGPSACSLHLILHTHVPSFTDRSSQAQQKVMTAELEAEPRCAEYSVSKSSFIANGVLCHGHQITKDPHSKKGRYFVVLGTKSNHINYCAKETTVCKTFCLELNRPACGPDPREDHASSPRQKLGSCRHWCPVKMGKQQWCLVPPFFLDLPLLL